MGHSDWCQPVRTHSRNWTWDRSCQNHIVRKTVVQLGRGAGKLLVGARAASWRITTISICNWTPHGWEGGKLVKSEEECFRRVQSWQSSEQSSEQKTSELTERLACSKRSGGQNCWERARDREKHDVVAAVLPGKFPCKIFLLSLQVMGITFYELFSDWQRQMPWKQFCVNTYKCATYFLMTIVYVYQQLI